MADRAGFQPGVTWGWQPVTSGVPWCSILRPVFFNAFINGPDAGFKCTLSEFAGDTEVRGAALQRDLHKLNMQLAITSHTMLNYRKF